MKRQIRNGWKRVCAAILSAAMTLTMLPVDAKAAPQMETVELVQNGDFESGTEGWSGFSDGEIERVVEEGTDNHILLVKNRKNTSSSARCALPGGIKLGTTYTIKGRFKYLTGPTGPDTKTFQMIVENGGKRDAIWGAIPDAPKGEWVTFEKTYTPKEENYQPGDNYFWIEGTWASGDDVAAAPDQHLMDYCIDDISITYEKVAGEEPEEPEADQLISNGSFENVPIDKNWKGMGGAKVERVEGVAHEGNASLKVSNYSAGWEGGRYELKDLLAEGKLVSGRKYTLTAWAKTASGSGKLSATIKGKVSGKDSYIGFGNADVSSGEWTKISGEISLADYDKDTDVMEVYWSWNQTVDEGAPAEFYLDDVTLTTPSDNIVRNGSFESGLDRWVGYEAGDAQILQAATDEYHSGSQSVKVVNRTKCANGPAQDLSGKLMPGSYYTVSAWVKYNDGPDTKNFNLTLQHGGTYDRTVVASGTVKKGEWTKIEAAWGVPSDMVTTSNFLFVETPWVQAPTAENDLMDFYVDDVSIIKYEDKTETLAKKFGYGNPITTNEFGADPYAIEYNGRVYVYMTADDYEFSDKDNPYSNNFGYITSLRVVSSADLMNWTDHGEIEVAGRNGGKGPAMWASHSWAPAIAYQKVDGKDKFFLYFANDASGIGVLEADTPLGPWKDPIGKALITKATPGCEKVEWCFDPAVLVDDDGEAYIYFGGGVPAGQSDNPKTARVAKLGKDMISLEGAAVEIDAPCMFEDSGIFKYNNKYYYSYCSNFTQSTKPGYPKTGTICYMVSDNPMGPFTYEGEIFSNPQVWFGVGGNNHHATFVFNNKSYFIYHAQTVSKALGVERGYRSTHIDEIELDEEGKIQPISGTYEGIAQLKGMNPYERVEAETIAWNAGVKASVSARPGNLFKDYNMALCDLQEGDWTAVSQLEFGSKGADKITVSAGSKDGGTIEVREGYPEGETIGTIEVPATGSNHIYKLVTGNIRKVTGTKNIFLIFHEKKAGATTETYQAELQSLWNNVKSAESSLPLKEQLQRQLTKAHNVSSGFAWNETEQKNALEAKISEAQAVAGNGSATDKQLTDAINTLNAAIDTADQYKATDKLLKEKLKYRIKYAEQLMDLLKDAQKKESLQNAIDNAKQLLRDDSIMNVDYFQFTEEGKQAPVEADKTLKEQLSEKAAAGKDLLAELSGAKKDALQSVITEVEKTLNKDNASEAEIKAALEKMDKAIEDAQKPGKPVEPQPDKKPLQDKITEAKGMLSGLSDAKKAALQTAINEAEAAINKANVSEAELTEALGKLNAAIEEAKKPEETKPDKKPLQDKVTEAKGLLSGLSEAKKTALQTAIDEAEAALNKANVSEAELTEALGKLNQAIEEAKKPEETKPDKKPLQDKITAAKAMLASLSEAKKAALQSVINEVEAILNNENASEAELSDALGKLEKAIEEAGKPDEKPPVVTAPKVGDVFTAPNGLKYKVTAYSSKAKNVTVTGISKKVTGITVPDTVSYKNVSFKVTSIGASAFTGQGTLKSAAIGKYVTSIGSKAFYNDKKLAKVTFKGTAVKTIGKDAFKNIKKGASFVMAKKTFTSKNLKYKITKSTTSAKEVTVTGTSNKNITTVTIPATVKYNGMSFKVVSIGKNAFKSKKKLKSATIGKYVKSIGTSAFAKDSKLTKITIKGTALKKVGSKAFSGISKKAKIKVPSKKLKAYKKLLKNKGQSKNVKITK